MLGGFRKVLLPVVIIGKQHVSTLILGIHSEQARDRFQLSCLVILGNCNQRPDIELLAFRHISHGFLGLPDGLEKRRSGLRAERHPVISHREAGVRRHGFRKLLVRFRTVQVVRERQALFIKCAGFVR